MPKLRFEKIGTLLKKLGQKSESEIIRSNALKILKKLEKGGYYGFEGNGVRWGVYKKAGTKDVGHFTVFRPFLSEKGSLVERHHIDTEGIELAMRITGQKRPTKKFKSYEDLLKWVKEK
jgi:metal-dependent HD superfamily phosphatase/phosphodiesterase